MDLSNLESGNYFDPSANGAGFTLIKSSDSDGPTVQATWYGFDESSNERHLVGTLKVYPSGDDDPEGFCMGAMWQAMGRGLRPTELAARQIGTLWLRAEGDRLVAELQVPHEYARPADVSPAPPPGTVINVRYELVRL